MMLIGQLEKVLLLIILIPNKKYTRDQINSEHIKLIVNTILRTDKRFKEIPQSNSDRAVFMKINF